MAHELYSGLCSDLNRKEILKRGDTYNRFILLYSRNYHNTVKQPYNYITPIKTHFKKGIGVSRTF